MTAVQRFGGGGPYEDRFGYSRVVVAGPHAWTAGCTSIVDGEVRHPGDPKAQAHEAFGAALSALEAVGFGVQDVVRTRMYIKHLGDAEQVGEVHAELFDVARPAATLVAVAGLLDPRMLVEVEVEAYRDPT